MRANATVLTRGVKRIMVIRLRLQEAKDKFMVYLANGRQIDANLAVFSSLLSKRYLMAKSERRWKWLRHGVIIHTSTYMFFKVVKPET
jgi:hypothetical protein